MKKTILSILMVAGILTAKAQVFQETLGIVSSNTAIGDHKGFSNNNLAFSGSAELQLQGSSAGKYTSASGGANLRIANVAGTDFVIKGINTNDVKSPVLGFGILKGPNSSNGSDLAVEFSTDGGKNWTRLKFQPLPTGEGTGLTWNYRETSPLPKVANLAVRFRQTENFVVFRLDDIGVLSKE